MAAPEVRVVGAGPAGLTCALLLSRCGWRVRLVRSGRRPRRPLALPALTVQMLQEIWGADVLRATPYHVLSARHVAWSGRAVDRIEAAMLSVDAADLGAALEARLDHCIVVEEAASDPSRVDATIDARGAAAGRYDVVAGARVMRIWQDIAIDRRAHQHAEVVASRGFWAFLLPTGVDRMSVQIATPTPALDWAAVAGSLGDARIGSLAHRFWDACDGPPAPSMATAIAPRLSFHSGDAGTLFVGDRAATFDPICGDGTGQGLRSALLVVAAMQGAAGQRPAAMLAHVAERHLSAFRSHLEHCVRLYRAIGEPEPWRAEVAAMVAASDRVAAPAPRAAATYRLVVGRDGANPRLEPSPA